MTIPEFVAQAIREVLAEYHRSVDVELYREEHLVQRPVPGPALIELARLFGIDMEALLKEIE